MNVPYLFLECISNFPFYYQCLSSNGWNSPLYPPNVVGNSKLTQPVNGSLQGKLTDEAGKFVAGATITFRHLFAIQSRNQQTTTKNDGTFNIAALPSGDYSYCVTVPKSDYVDDCEWNLTFLPRVVSKPSPTQLTTSAASTLPVFAGDLPHSSGFVVVPPGATSSVQQLQVRSGARVRIRFVDSGKLIDGRTDLMVGALNPVGMFVCATRTTTGAVTSYEQVIPFNTKVRLVVRSSGLRATGPNGNVNLAAGVTEVVVGPKDPPLIVNYNITGKLN